MVLSAGTRLGTFEILAPLGAGGMGEVYKAKDTRLDRTVAIKVLPEHLSRDPERRERFEREARAVSSLNHPHICTIYEFDTQAGIDFIVMEYLEGESLADRLARGALPLGQALDYAVQIADGLDKAHRQGVVHRDLKPGNIMLTKPGVKLLDFGLAKLQEDRSLTSDSERRTRQKPLTDAGTIMGTVQYMAPEQLEGKEVDARTDLFAFGAVLYEMVTGRKAFEGESQASLIAAIMSSEPPPVSDRQPMSPRALDRLVKTCLAKEPDQRWGSARDVERELTWISEAGLETGVAVVAKPMHHKHLARGLTLAFAVIVAGIAGWNLKPVPARAVTRLSVLLPRGEQFTNTGHHVVALSPDGAHLVYVGSGQIYLRAMDQMVATPLRGTEGGGRSPFFSPDGNWVAFFATRDDGRGELRKVTVGGGAPITLCEDFHPYGASWGADDTIVFGQSGKGILRVSAAGGVPEVLVPMSITEGYAQGPQILPGGKSLLFTFGNGVNWNDAQIVVQSLTTGERRVLIEGGTDARYVSTGHLVYALRGTLFAVPFDAHRLEVTGGPVSLIDGVAMAGAGAHTGDAHFSVSDTGSLVYVARDEIARMRTLVWVDRAGREKPLEAPPRVYTYPRISPDGTRLALDIEDQEHDIWLWSFARQTLTRLTFDAGLDQSPLWTRDGRRIVFSSFRGRTYSLSWKAADGASAAEQIMESENYAGPHSLSSDGKQLVFWEYTPEGRRDLRVLSLEGERSSKALLATEFNELNGEVSPDGRWLAYESDESGQHEIYVRPFPNVNEGHWQISTDGGTRPLWGRDGQELFYLALGGGMRVVPVRTDPGFTAARARILFEEAYYAGAPPFWGRTYDISPDGERFLMIKESKQDTSAPVSITVVLNWHEELKRLVPADK